MRSKARRRSAIASSYPPSPGSLIASGIGPPRQQRVRNDEEEHSCGYPVECDRGRGEEGKESRSGRGLLYTAVFGFDRIGVEIRVRLSVLIALLEPVNLLRLVPFFFFLFLIFVRTQAGLLVHKNEQPALLVVSLRDLHIVAILVFPFFVLRELHLDDKSEIRSRRNAGTIHDHDVGAPCALHSATDWIERNRRWLLPVGPDRRIHVVGLFGDERGVASLVK